MNRLLLAAGVFLGGMAIVIAGCGVSSVPAPTGYTSYNAPDGTFRIDCPNDWEADGGGRHGVQWATFKRGSALIKVSVSFGESVVGDILGSGFGGGEATRLIVDELGNAVQQDEVNPPVAIIHAKKREEIEEKYSDYREKEAVEVRPPLGEGRKSEFKASSGLMPVHGYRVTILNNQRGVTVICHCSEKDWEMLQGAFDQIIDKISRGTATR